MGGAGLACEPQDPQDEDRGLAGSRDLRGSEGLQRGRQHEGRWGGVVGRDLEPQSRRPGEGVWVSFRKLLRDPLRGK